VFVFVNDAGAVTQAPSLPTMCVPLALAVTDATAITNLQDLRSQVSEHVRPRSESGVSGFDIGDIKPSTRSDPSTGWAWADGAIYNDIDYPLAAAAIGRKYSLPSDPVGTFRVIDMRGRTLIGSTFARPAGTIGGSETVSLTAAQNGRHSHATTETGHTHGSTSNHGHNTVDPGHGHPVLGSYETSGGSTDSIIVENAAIAGETGGSFGYTTENNSNAGQRLILPQPTGMQVLAGSANVQVASATTGLSVRDAGEGAPHDNMMPFNTCHYFVRLF
jgi:microcystin-dependent protein